MLPVIQMNAQRAAVKINRSNHVGELAIARRRRLRRKRNLTSLAGLKSSWF